MSLLCCRQYLVQLMELRVGCSKEHDIPGNFNTGDQLIIVIKIIKEQVSDTLK